MARGSASPKRCSVVVTSSQKPRWDGRCGHRPERLAHPAAMSVPPSPDPHEATGAAWLPKPARADPQGCRERAAGGAGVQPEARARGRGQSQRAGGSWRAAVHGHLASGVRSPQPLCHGLGATEARRLLGSVCTPGGSAWPRAEGPPCPAGVCDVGWHCACPPEVAVCVGVHVVTGGDSPGLPRVGSNLITTATPSPRSRSPGVGLAGGEGINHRLPPSPGDPSLMLSCSCCPGLCPSMAGPT